ncbi:MAG: nucleotidyltransferase domain-containing protein [Bacteroidota bacterium]|nr:nucleotidyltransferase domain-containing protein [Bacteroidota bacterium]
MRISEEMRTFFVKEFVSILPDAQVYLFGSRTDDTKKGGDIDVLILGSRKLEKTELNSVRNKFWQRFGEQKLDLVSFFIEEDNNFKEIALSTSIKLS